MSAYATVDQVAARFPKFKRSGAFVAIASIARAADVVTVTFPGPFPAVGWNAAIVGVTGGATAFDGTYIVTAAGGSTFGYYQAGPDEAGVGGLASVSRAGAIADGQIQNWIDEAADYVIAIAQSRGFDLANLPAATAGNATTLLRNLNKLAAQVLLGEAIQAEMGLTSEWALLTAIRQELQLLQKQFGAGAYDKLFAPAARTQDSGPQLGGYVPGYGVKPCSHAHFKKEREL